MRLFNYELSLTKAAPGTAVALQAPSSRNGYWPIVREPFSGAWQRNLEIRNETVLTYHALYSCVTLIASDVAKCRPRVVEQDGFGIWAETNVPAYSPVIRKPNRNQNRIQFFEQWVISKLIQGNTYVLKGRDERKVVNALYILDASRTRPLVATNGDVYYELKRDNLAGLEDEIVIVPASEIIHDVMIPLYHPLCGVSPITACGLAAVQGLGITSNSSKFFSNGSHPGGILTAPHHIDDDTAKRIKEHWENKFSGENMGKVAVLGDGLKFEQMAVKAVDAQLIEQLKWSAETVCSAFHVPGYMVGVGAAPPVGNIEALGQQYYSQCLQKLFECIELCLDEGLGIVNHKEHSYGIEFDLDDLLRMDTATLIEAQSKAVGAGIRSPNEARRRLNDPPVKGGDTPYLQQQNFSLAALDERDRSENPFGTPKPPPLALPKPEDDDEAEEVEVNFEQEQAKALLEVYKGLTQ